MERTREALRPITGRACGGAGAVNDDHYSYRLYADPAMADRFDAMRFSGPIGTLLAEEQDRVIASFLGPLAGRTVLDVGTGTGRAAIGLARRGARVTGLDASAEMLACRAGARRGGRRRRGLRGGGRPPVGVRRPGVSLRGQLESAHAHARLAALPGGTVPGGRRPRRLRLPLGLQRSRAAGVEPAPRRRRGPSCGGVPRAEVGRRQAYPGRRRLSHRSGAPAVRPAHRRAQGDRVPGLHRWRSRSRWRLSAFCELLGSPITVVATRCAR